MTINVPKKYISEISHRQLKGWLENINSPYWTHLPVLSLLVVNGIESIEGELLSGGY